MTPYRSSRAALADAARLSAPLDVRPRREVRVQRTANEDRQDGPIAVRAALRAAGLDPDGREAQLLYGWAVDELEVEEGSELADRLEDLLDRVRPALEVAGVVARPLPVRLLRVGWRVLEFQDGRRRVHMVTEPRGDDATVYRSLEAAQAVASRALDGEVHKAEITASKRRHPELAGPWLSRWTAGEFGDLQDLDRALAAEQGWTERWARAVRTSWGLRRPGRGRPRKAATRPLLGEETDMADLARAKEEL